MKRLLPLLLLAALPAMLPAQPAWVRQHLQSIDTVLYGIAFTDADHGVAAGTGGVLYRTTDGGGTWASRPSGTTERLTRVRFFSSTLGFVTGDNGMLLKTLDGGETWTRISTTTTKSLFDVYFVDEDSGFVTGQAGVLYATKNKGATWTSVDADFGGNNIYTITFATPRIGICVGNVGGISRTSNGGRTWRKITSGTSFTLYGASFATAKVATAVGDAGAIRTTTDGGLSWKEDYASVPLTSYPLGEIQYADSTTGFIAGFYGMVLRKAPGDQMWMALDNPYADPLECLSFVTPKLGYLSGWHSTVLKTQNGGMAVGTGEVTRAADNILLAPSYPNPLRLGRARRSTIAFALRERAHAVLTVHNALGETVATLMDGDLEAGRYIRHWDVPALPAGLYYYRLRAGTGSMTRALSILP
jgi:photosystem II stability/assembly factor-like uncharacterized protein